MTKFKRSIYSSGKNSQQRGMGTLAVSLILLVVMTLVAFAASNTMLFEQKTSANQLRATKAFEAAEAGIEWATSMLNDVQYINASCTLGAVGATQSFRTKYLPYDPSSGFTPTASAQPGCSMSMTSGLPVRNCSCPNSGTDPTLNSATDATFAVKFQAVNSTNVPDGTPNTESVLVTSYGCTSADARCVPGATGTADGFQKISVILKLRPGLRAMPPAAITAGGNVALGSAASSIINTDPASNGILVNTGGTCCGGQDFASASTLPGSPVKNAFVTSDTSLSSLSASQDGMFQSIFGTTVAQFKADIGTKVLTAGVCGGNCEAAFNAEYAKGYRAFYLEDAMQVSSGTIGTAANPVILATSANIRFNGGTDVWGLIYADSANWDPTGLGSGTMNGAIVTRNNFSANGNPQFKYDADALAKTRGLTGSLLRVPGSWKDF